MRKALLSIALVLCLVGLAFAHSLVILKPRAVAVNCDGPLSVDDYTGFESSIEPIANGASGTEDGGMLWEKTRVYGSINFDATAGGAAFGSQYMRIDSGVNQLSYTIGALSSVQSDGSLFFAFRPDATPQVNGNFIDFNLNGSSSGTKVTYRADSSVRITHGTVTVTSSTGVITNGEWNYVWVDVDQGTGSNGVLSVYISDSRTKPLSPIATTSVGDASTATFNQIVLLSGVVGTHVANIYDFDQVLWSNTFEGIGDICN